MSVGDDSVVLLLLLLQEERKGKEGEEEEEVLLKPCPRGCRCGEQGNRGVRGEAAADWLLPASKVYT